MKNTKKKLNSQSKIVKASFSGSNITKYSGLNTVAKYIHPVKLVSDLAKLFNGVNRQNIVKVFAKSFPTVWHNATKFGINQISIATTLSSISGISRICKMATFSGDGLVKALLKLDKAINENAISGSSKRHKNKERRKT